MIVSDEGAADCESDSRVLDVHVDGGPVGTDANSGKFAVVEPIAGQRKHLTFFTDPANVVRLLRIFANEEVTGWRDGDVVSILEQSGIVRFEVKLDVTRSF